jgi:hypothetical protein
MGVYMKQFRIVVLLCFILMTMDMCACIAEDKVVNNGMDITRPLTRFDVRYQFQNLPSPANGNNNIFILRADRPFTLESNMKLSTRIDMPFLVSNAIGPDNLDGKTKAGLGDFLAQAHFIYVPSQRFAYLTGAQFMFPTASTDEMGSGKYTILPTLGARMDMHEISRGSFSAMLFRYNVDYAGNSSRKHISELQFAPFVLINLPQLWFINLFPSPDIRYNFADERPGDKGRWFIPLDFMVGKMLNKTTVVSMEVSIPIIKDYNVYDFKAEVRVGFFF